MFTRIFGKPKEEANTVTTLDKLNEEKVRRMEIVVSLCKGPNYDDSYKEETSVVFPVCGLVHFPFNSLAMNGQKLDRIASSEHRREKVVDIVFGEQARSAFYGGDEWWAWFITVVVSWTFAGEGPLRGIIAFYSGSLMDAYLTSTSPKAVREETLEMLEKKEKVLLKKAAGEVEKAKEFTRAKNKRAAIQCLKRKKLYEQQIEQLGNFQLRLHDQMIMLEGAKATTETVDALRTGAAAMKAMQKATNIDDVDKTMDEINEQTENMKQIQEALSAPLGAAADFDEDELEAELEELEGAELEEQLLQPATTAPAAPVHVPAGRQPARPVAHKNTAEEDELAALQAEMAL
ncbi:hypothetical protein RJ640_006335 [Escallonia rubra]|uniref:Uncharacterized protein n=1 Tax=Escallonia rubra TaxID=112253 RepID=A0AA88UI43_9ASTE|nr:hypothetical protein RJ640_006335 [Escallonia rubra]